MFPLVNHIIVSRSIAPDSAQAAPEEDADDETTPILPQSVADATEQRPEPHLTKSSSIPADAPETSDAAASNAPVAALQLLTVADAEADISASNATVPLESDVPDQDMVFDGGMEAPPTQLTGVDLQDVKMAEP